MHIHARSEVKQSDAKHSAVAPRQFSRTASLSVSLIAIGGCTEQRTVPWARRTGPWVPHRTEPMGAQNRALSAQNRASAKFSRAFSSAKFSRVSSSSPECSRVISSSPSVLVLSQFSRVFSDLKRSVAPGAAI